MNGFTILDYVVLVGTVLISMLIGAYYAFVKKQKTNEELLVGNRNMGVVTSCLSLVATYMSAILILGYSGEVYSHGTLICEAIVGAFIFVPLGGALFLPTLYPLKLTSAYEYLELRFASKGVRLIATLTFVIQITLYMGVVLFAPAVALEAVLGVPIWVSIICCGGCAAIYTSMGGLRAVILTDSFQILMMFSGMIAIIIQGTINVGGVDKVLEIAKAHKRLEFLNFEVDPFLRHSSLNIFFGQEIGNSSNGQLNSASLLRPFAMVFTSGVLWMSAYGCHQSTVQRYCMLAFTMSLAGVTGVVVFANYAGCDPLSLNFIKRSDQIAPFYVLDKLSATSGILGLFMACLFSGALSTISSAINSLSAVTVEDFMKKLSFFRTMDPIQQGLVTKGIGLLYGVCAIGMGFLAQNLGGVLSATIVVNGTVAGPLLGVFLLGVLIPFSNKTGAIIGMLSAHAITFWISIGALVANRTHPTLHFSLDECSNETLTNVMDLDAAVSRLNASNTILHEDVPWPEKIYTVSYMLYPLIGTIITVTVGSIVSLASGSSKLTEEEMKQYIHPFIYKIHRRLNRGAGNNPNRLELTDAKSFGVVNNGFENGNANKNNSTVATEAGLKGQ